MSKDKMIRAMVAGETLEYADASGQAWYDKSRPTGQQFRFRSDVVEEETLDAGWEWPDWRIREERKELAP